jgi:hypothetical protein
MLLNGCYEFVQIILLEDGTKVKALTVASGMGRSAILRQLLEKEANVNTQCRKYSKEPKAASEIGYDGVVQLLREPGAVRLSQTYQITTVDYLSEIQTGNGHD